MLVIHCWFEFENKLRLHNCTHYMYQNGFFSLSEVDIELRNACVQYSVWYQEYARVEIIPTYRD